jgi:carbon monoxide dehydrogenase subunit G
MGKVTCVREVAAPPDGIWAVLADFGGFLEWTGGSEGRSIELEGDGVGMVRHLVLPGIGEMAERLEKLDHENRTQVYALVSGQPLGMAEYEATVVVKEASGGAVLEWTGTFSPAPGADTASIAEGLRRSYEGMSEALAAAARR